ncbi:endonuclease/Exonuclease/phosphatase [Elsinoe ampelina]|uniref:Endonuclease/Exonuclease/phosphatase n=1 Tax=Elsinoe ampelina TaxID=302913 RepID=A0A6A6GA32_9PEZI|nr:endonuclease/Exonuclease/phosphatase [Elsinoe ampelina]
MFKTLAQASLLALTSAQSIAQINGNGYISPFNGQAVTGVTGVVTAKNANGFFLRSTTPDNDDRTSESIFVFNRTEAARRNIGDVIRFDGRVAEFRSTQAYVPLTQLQNPVNVVVLSGNGSAVPQPLVLGTVTDGIIGRKELFPPTELYTSLDDGDVFGVPNNRSLISTAGRVLQPNLYGMDFWESLMGELVTIPRPTAAARPNSFGDTWVYGNWTVTGLNSRGGLTILNTDANPEVLIVGTPLDGTRNPNATRLGDSLDDITGVIYQQFGFYYILPQTALRVRSSRSPALPPVTALDNNPFCFGFTAGDYNVENLSPNSTSLQGVAGHIATYLKSPTMMFVQEIQDNNGPTNDAVVSANETLTALRDEVVRRGGARYDFVDIAPVDDANGGQPGGNIRTSYLYDSRYMKLFRPNPGNATTGTEIIPAKFFGIGGPTLSLNPGLIDPTNEAWEASRKPLVAQWTTFDGISRFFTINLHLTSKGGSSSLQGDPRPPVNGGVEQRLAQLTVVGNFVKRILDLDPNAAIIVAGDFNEFDSVAPVEEFKRISGMININDAAGLAETERYTYLFGQNCQEIDQIFVSPKIARRKPQIDHVHINSWVSTDEVVSDHDPSVAKMNICV